MADCIFCKILKGEIPGKFVLRGEHVSAFMDILPINPGHLLVIPHAHAAELAGLDPEDGAELFRSAQKMATALRKSGLRCEGVNLHLADGKAAGQEVGHVHLHVIPRFEGDGFGFKRGEQNMRKPTGEELDRNAEMVRKVL